MRAHAGSGASLLQKPSSCQGCPAYGDGKGFVPDTIRSDAKVVIWAQGPGESEEQGQRYLGGEQWEAHPPAPLIGKTGRILDRTFLPLAGLNREDISLANSIRCRWNHKNQLPPLNRVEVQTAIKHCTQAHGPRLDPGKLYIAMGEFAFYTLTGLLYDFSGWRGYLLPKRHPWEPRDWNTVSGVWTPNPLADKVFVTHHLAYLWKEPEAELPAKRDWNKIVSILDGTWPVPFTHYETEPPNIWPSYAAFDTEFDDQKRLVRYSLATRDRNVWVVEADQARKQTVAPGTTVIMHNAPADLPHLKTLVNVKDLEIEDTMYAHAVLWTGKVETDEDKGKGGGAMSHKLNFLGSLYARINRWKHLSKVSPKRYAGGDALGTMDVWETGLHGGLKGELARDPQSQWVYENLQKPLIPIIVKNQATGIAVDREKVKVALKAIGIQQQREVLRAQAYAGWSINLRSPKQLAYWLFDVEGLKVRRKVNARYAHLSPR